ncbi:MAG: hypothetical protein H6719_00100, partial [Sandaracinaceae bacterium]|nr:hypothetical protein [Sandaracinaceae bacterium]
PGDGARRRGGRQESTIELIEAAHGSSTPLVAPSSPPPRRRLPVGALVAASLVLCGVTAAVTWAIRRSPDEPPAVEARLASVPAPSPEPESEPRVEPPAEALVVDVVEPEAVAPEADTSGADTPEADAPEADTPEADAPEPGPAARPARSRRRRRAAPPSSRRGGALGMSAFDQSTGR